MADLLTVPVEPALCLPVLVLFLSACCKLKLSFRLLNFQLFIHSTSPIPVYGLKGVQVCLNNGCSITLACRRGGLCNVQSLWFQAGMGEKENQRSLSVNHIRNQFVMDTKPHKAAVLPEKWLTTFQFVFHVEQTKVIFKVMPWQKICGYLHESPMDAWGYLSSSQTHKLHTVSSIAGGLCFAGQLRFEC